MFSFSSVLSNIFPCTVWSKEEDLSSHSHEASILWVPWPLHPLTQRPWVTYGCSWKLSTHVLYQSIKLEVEIETGIFRLTVERDYWRELRMKSIVVLCLTWSTVLFQRNPSSRARDSCWPVTITTRWPMVAKPRTAGRACTSEAGLGGAVTFNLKSENQLPRHNIDCLLTLCPEKSESPVLAEVLL